MTLFVAPLGLLILLARIVFIHQPLFVSVADVTHSGNSNKYFLMAEVFKCRITVLEKLQKRHYRYLKYKRSYNVKQIGKIVRCKYVCVTILLLCGDIETNPGPTVCRVCGLSINNFDLTTLRCGTCANFYHIRCTCLSGRSSSSLRVDDFTSWNCEFCVSAVNKFKVLTCKKRRLYFMQDNHDVPNAKRNLCIVQQDHP